MIDVKHVVPLTLLAQLCVGLVVAGVAWVGFDATAGISALLGAATAYAAAGKRELAAERWATLQSFWKGKPLARPNTDAR